MDPRYFKDGQRGMMWVGLAGPATNFAVALVAAGLIWLTYTWSIWLAQALYMLFVLNVILGTINLIPIPPLDGSRVLGGFLPRATYARWQAFDRYGTLVFAGLFIVMVAFPGVYSATIGAVLQWSYHLLPGG